MVLAGVDLRRETLEKRRAIMETKVISKLIEPVRYTLGAVGCSAPGA